MSRLLLTNAVLLDPEADQPVSASLLLERDRIRAVLQEGDDRPDDAEAIDLSGRQIAPGFLDLHFHGELAFAAPDAFHDALDRAGASMVRHGTTAFLATTIAWPRPELAAAIERIASLIGTQRVKGAAPIGLHLEGPWLNPAAAGAQPRQGIRIFDPKEGSEILARASGLIRMVTLAPEVPGASALLDALTAGDIVAALGHSLATPSRIEEAVTQGMTHVTHIFNAMGPVHHREPGVPGHVLGDDRLSCDLICDGVHVHPSMVKLAARSKPGALILITDRLDLPPSTDRSEAGEDLTRLGGAEAVREQDSAWRLADGRLAGSMLRLDQSIRNIQSYGAMTLLEAVAACTLLPARILGLEAERGSLRPGARADLAILDPHGQVVETWIGGRPVYPG